MFIPRKNLLCLKICAGHQIFVVIKTTFTGYAVQIGYTYVDDVEVEDYATFYSFREAKKFVLARAESELS